jgi:hypothetical protein
LIERWLNWRAEHDVAREASDALLLAAVTCVSWVMLGKTAGIVFGVLSLSLIAFGFIGTALKRRRVCHGTNQ